MNREHFRFLSCAEFSDMNAEERVAYLFKAGREVRNEERWQELAVKARLHIQLAGKDK